MVRHPLLAPLLIIALLFAGMGSLVVGRAASSSLLAASGWICLAGCVALWTYVAIREGTISSNWGTFRRQHEPVRFYLDVAIMTLISLALVAAGIATALRGSNWRR